MQALRYLGLCPTQELSTRIDGLANKTAFRRDDLAKRITLFAVTLIILLSFVMIGLACAQLVHPMVGVGLFLGALCLSTVPCYLMHHQRSLLPPDTKLEDFYHPPTSTSKSSSSSSSRSHSPGPAQPPHAQPPPPPAGQQQQQQQQQQQPSP